MKKLNLLLILFVLLFSETRTQAQFPTFTLIDTGIVCTAGGYSNSAVFGDFNNDGLDDLIIVNIVNSPGPISHLLFINEGNWNFRQIREGDIPEYSSTYGSHGANWGDYDNNGDMDLFIASIDKINNVLFKNNGDSSFTRITSGAIVNDGGDSGPAAWIDIENDGYIDLYVENHWEEKNFLYHNNGDGTFTKNTNSELVNFFFPDEFGMTSVDIDNDRDNDIIGLGASDENYLYINDGNGNFSLADGGDLTESDYGANYIAWGDYDNDGYLDAFIGTWSTGDYNILCHNNGNGTFTKVFGIEPVNDTTGTDDGSWADFDNDGYLDLFTQAKCHTKNFIYRNNGDKTFTKLDITSLTDVIGGYTSLEDINNDGFIDIFIARGYDRGCLAENVILANDGNANSWLTVNLTGMVSNRDALGARVKAKAMIGGNPMWQVREIGVSGLAGHKHAYFGFGDAISIDSLVVQWPAGHDTILENVAVNQILNITEEIPKGYLRASFAVDTTMGRGEISVQFTNISRFDPISPVTSWSWDFDGDGVEDSNEQNPEHLYSNPDGEVYNVSLIVSNGTSSDTIIRKGFFRLYPFRAENLAQWSKVLASSEGHPVWNAENAIDGEMLTRWSSSYNNNEWLRIEMDSVYTIGKIIIHWEAAYGKGYLILTSEDGSDWDTVYCEDSGDGSEDILLFTGIDAKYVILKGLKRGTQWGYSIWEFEIYRSDGNQYDPTCIPDTGDNIFNNYTGIDDKISVYPNPFNESVTFSFTLEKSADVQLDIIDLLGRKIVNIYNRSLKPGNQNIIWNSKDNNRLKVKSGYYIYYLKVDDILKSTGKLLITD